MRSKRIRVHILPLYCVNPINNKTMRIYYDYSNLYFFSIPTKLSMCFLLLLLFVVAVFQIHFNPSAARSSNSGEQKKNQRIHGNAVSHPLVMMMMCLCVVNDSCCISCELNNTLICFDDWRCSVCWLFAYVSSFFIFLIFQSYVFFRHICVLCVSIILPAGFSGITSSPKMCNC